MGIIFFLLCFSFHVFLSCFHFAFRRLKHPASEVDVPVFYSGLITDILWLLVWHGPMER